MTYPLVNVVTIAACAVIRGADDLVAVATRGRLKRDRLTTILDLRAGAPSHDRFNAIFQAMDPGAFEKRLLGWIADLHEATAGQVVAIDGEVLRRGFDRASGKSAVRVVSAWATANRLSLGRVVVEAKSDESRRSPPCRSCWT